MGESELQHGMGRHGASLRTLLARLVLLFFVVDLGGCYFRNQAAFDSRIRKEVAVGMPVQDAMARLSKMRLSCIHSEPADCSRVRQSLLPYSCVERVRLHWAEQTQRVTRIEIPDIVCAGL